MMNDDEIDINEIFDSYKNDSEQYWNSLSKEEQLKVFCAVSRRLFQGEIKDKGSYRYILYNIFGFGPEAYLPAHLSGYLAIHNAIWNHEDDGK